MVNQKVEILLFLGAGFSIPAGFPLAKDLFTEIPYSPYKDGFKIYEKVKSAWEETGKNLAPEQWVKAVYSDRDSLPEFKYGISWEDLQDFILARVVSIPKGKNSHYYHGISTSVENNCHRVFWQKVLGKYSIRKVITTNFDILIEQGLKTSYLKERSAPICYYGGYPYNQAVRKMTNITKGEYKLLELGHEVELLKLHGSINWVNERHAYKIHDDVRAVFRKSRDLGKPRIIPPLEEKEQPEWSFDIWERARIALRETSTWLVCGYSFPEYDYAIRRMVAECAASHKELCIIISDPNGEQVRKSIEALLPAATKYQVVPGLPNLNVDALLN